MKKNFFSVFVLLMSTAQVFAGDFINIKLEMKVQDNYQSCDRDYVGVNSRVSSTLNIKGSVDGQIVDSMIGPEDSVKENKSVLKEISGNSVRMVDEKLKSDIVIAAQVESGFFSGKVKKIVISSEQLKIAMAKSLEDQKQGLLTAFNISNGKANLEYDLNLSDYVCEASENGLSCVTTIGVEVNASSL